VAQQIMLDVVLGLADGDEVDVNMLKKHAIEAAPKVTKDELYDGVRDGVKALCVKQGGAKSPAPATAEASPTTAKQPEEAKK
jgi:hypothetical protein